jgi:hypothetical protein
MNPEAELKIVLLAAATAVIGVNLSLKKGERRRGVAFAAAWLVPGAGHVVLGRWGKGLFFFLTLGLTYVFGLWIVGFRAVSFDDNPFYYVGQYGSGLTFLLARLMSEHKAFPRLELHPSWFDPGLLYVCVAGLLNVVIMMNVLDLKPAPAPAPAAAAAPPAEAAPAVKAPVEGPAPEKTA